MAAYRPTYANSVQQKRPPAMSAVKTNAAAYAYRQARRCHPSDRVRFAAECLCRGGGSGQKGNTWRSTRLELIAIASRFFRLQAPEQARHARRRRQIRLCWQRRTTFLPDPRLADETRYSGMLSSKQSGSRMNETKNKRRHIFPSSSMSIL